MGFQTEIGWTDGTFNAWIGCAKISRGCRFCYAESQERRWHPAQDGRRSAEVWGRTALRRRTSPGNWAKPRHWNKLAEKAREPYRVFGFSLADVFEDHPMLPPWRKDFFDLVEATPWLRWMLLTKRIDLVEEMTAEQWGTDWPDNVWLGTSVEGQSEADDRLPILLNINGPKERFASAEPLLEPTTVARHLAAATHPLSLLIAGGESGLKARPMDPAWALKLVDEAYAAGVPLFFKQHGEYRGYAPDDNRPPTLWLNRDTAVTVRSETDVPDTGDWLAMYRLGKAAAGRELDGRTYDGVVESWAREMSAA